MSSRVMATGSAGISSLFTLPWRGRVGERSSPGWGEDSVGCHGLESVVVSITPPRSLTRATLPLQGRVKKSIPQQLIDAGLAARALVDALDDHGAIQARADVAAGHRV